MKLFRLPRWMRTDSWHEGEETREKLKVLRDAIKSQAELVEEAVRQKTRHEAQDQ